MGHSHTWMRTWTSRGYLCNHMAIYYLSDSFADGISPILSWALGRAEAPVWTWPSTTCLSHLSMGFLPYLAENLDEQRYLGKIMVNVSQSSLPIKDGYVLLYSTSFTKFIKLHHGKMLGVNIYNLAFYQNIMELDHTFLYHVMYDTRSLCALTCHEIHDSLTSPHYSGYLNESQLALEYGQKLLQ